MVSKKHLAVAIAGINGDLKAQVEFNRLLLDTRNDIEKSCDNAFVEAVMGEAKSGNELAAALKESFDKSTLHILKTNQLSALDKFLSSNTGSLTIPSRRGMTHCIQHVDDFPYIIGAV